MSNNFFRYLVRAYRSLFFPLIIRYKFPEFLIERIFIFILLKNNIYKSNSIDVKVWIFVRKYVINIIKMGDGFYECRTKTY